MTTCIMLDELEYNSITGITSIERNNLPYYWMIGDGINVKSPKTGKVCNFTVSHCELTDNGDIVWLDYRTDDPIAAKISALIVFFN